MNRRMDRPNLIDRRKNLRNESTPAEAVLWRHLKNRQIHGKKFRRQFSIGPYIVDFFCPECRLICELDGSPHFDFDGMEYESRRREYLENLGLIINSPPESGGADCEGVSA